MGHVSVISLGIARNTKKRVICLDGDGSVIMHMGNLTTLGTSNCSNFIHIVLNNGMHESVGIQPTTAFDVNLSDIAKNCGYKKSKSISTIEDLKNELSTTDLEGPSFIEIKISNKVNYKHELSRPKDTPKERKLNL